jgi:hypothetical protein
MPCRKGYLLIAVVWMTTAIPIFGAEPDNPVLDRYQIRATERPPFWMPAAEKAHILCQDGGAPIPLPDGSSLWTFGDTFYGRKKGPKGEPQYEGAVSSSVCRVTITPQGPKAEYLADAKGRVEFLLPLHKSESWSRHRVWPAGGVHLNGVTYLYYTRVTLKDNPGDTLFGFEDDGAGLAKAEDNSWQFQRLLMPHDNPPLPMLPACGLAREKDLYLFFIEKTGAMESAIFLARVPAAEAAQPNAYRFWAGKGIGFSASMKKRIALVNDIWGQVSVAWNAYLRRYVMLHVGGLFRNPRSIYLRTAEQPEGPWSKPVRVMALPGELGKDFKGLIYCAYLHPELFRDNGRWMTFTYCVLQRFGNPKLMEFELVSPASGVHPGHELH